MESEKSNAKQRMDLKRIEISESVHMECGGTFLGRKIFGLAGRGGLLIRIAVATENKRL
jgi:hypothetical protein